MTNQILLVGRLANQPKMEQGVAIITLAVPRSYKNEEGVYETDFINITLNGGVATNTCEYCKKGDLVGVRGRLQMNEKLEVIADRITFLSSNKDLINRED